MFTCTQDPTTGDYRFETTTGSRRLQVRIKPSTHKRANEKEQANNFEQDKSFSLGNAIKEVQDVTFSIRAEEYGTCGPKTKNHEQHQNKRAPVV